MFGSQADENEAELAKARTALQQFEDNVGWRDLLARLQRASPMHPFLLFRNVSAFLFVASALGMIGLMGMSVISRDFAERINGIERVIVVPIPALLGLIAVVAFFSTILAFVGAISSGRQAPFLPHEAKVHQRLLADVQQLEAKRSVKERMTPKPATPRLIDRRRN